MRLSDYIKQRREALGMNRAALTRAIWGTKWDGKIHPNYSTLRAWEIAGASPDERNRKLLAKALSIPVMVLDLVEHGIPFTINPETNVVEILDNA
jgi:ribosome-binding protein aMBF1 (putative translation factor)